jgi:fibronectin type 3 domain-containing protein
MGEKRRSTPETSPFLAVYVAVLILTLLLATPKAFAGTVTLAWDAPTTNEDGTPLTDLAGYNVYYGTSSSTYTQVKDAGTATTYDVTNLTVGTTYYFSVKARDYSGNESIFSNEVSATVSATPIPDILVTDSVAPSDDLQIPLGSVTVGNYTDQSITVTNDGNADLVIDSVAQNDPLALPFSIQTDTCTGQSLAPAANCSITVRFAPSSTGPWSDSLDVASNDPDEGAVTVSVSGSGTSAPTPDITLTDSVAPSNDLQIPFGSVTEGSWADQTVTVKNDGNADLTITSVAQSNPLGSPFSIQASTCSGQVLVPAASCTVTVRFAPASPVLYNDNFEVGSNDPDENPVTVTVTGSGTATPVPDITVTDSVAPTSDLQVAFGSITAGGSSVEQVTVTNDGDAGLVIGNISTYDPLYAPFSIQSDTCSGATLAPSGSCSIQVLFAPSTDGTFNESFGIPSNDPDEGAVTVSVSGTGLPAGTNNPPSQAVLVSPANGQQGVGPDVTFVWEPSIDPDGDAVSYDLYVSDSASFSGGTVINVAGLQSRETKYAGFAGSAAGLLLTGLALAGGLSRRRKVALLITVLALAGMMLASCGGGADFSLPTAGTPGAGGVSQQVSGLQSGTTYYWKVVAYDDKGASSESEIRNFTTP